MDEPTNMTLKFSRKAEDELRTCSRIGKDFINLEKAQDFYAKVRNEKQSLSNVNDEKLSFLSGLSDKEGLPTLCGILLFGVYPQYFSPGLDIVAEVYSSTKREDEKPYLIKKRFGGTIKQMLESALAFVYQNMRITTVIGEDGRRRDVPEYPIKAVREILINALVHRDYSIYTENDPIRIEMYPDRMEISNPGGLYGRMTIEELGTIRADVRNPFLASALEILEECENRYSGIPTIYGEMRKLGLPDPLFEDRRGMFRVTLFNGKSTPEGLEQRIIDFCRKPRTKEAIAKEFNFDEKRPSYFFNTYVKPLVEKGLLNYTIPDKPKSKNQRIVTA